MKQTAVEFLLSYLPQIDYGNDPYYYEIIKKAKELEKQDTENKAIHFAEWLTNKHTLELMRLYEHFEEQYYNETFNK